MIIFLYGQDSYRISQKLKEIKEKYQAKNPNGFNLISLDFSENSIKDLEHHLVNSSLMPGKKLIILKNIFSADAGQILNVTKSQNLSKREDIIFVAVSFKDAKNELFNYLTKKPCESQNFNLLKNYEIKNWTIKFARDFNINFTSEALDYLILNCNGDLWRLDSEINKLANYKQKGVISLSQVEELVTPNANQNIFEITDGLAAKNKRRAISSLHKLLDSGEAPTEILGLLAWQARNILKFKSDSSKILLHPYMLAKTGAAAKVFSIEELSSLLKKISKLDLELKTTNVEAKTALSLLISEL